MGLQTANTPRRRRNGFRQFFLRASLARLGVAMTAAPIGYIITWRQMTYSGDETSYVSILAVALALSFSPEFSLGYWRCRWEWRPL